MKKYIVLFLMSFPALAGDSGLALSQYDRQLHAAVGYAATLTLSELLYKHNVPMPELVAAGIVLTGAIVKESLDNQFSVGDIKAGTLGIGLATVVSWRFHL